MITYDKLWLTLKQKGISQNKLVRDFGISTSQLHRLRKNQVVYTSTIDTLCCILCCDITDVMEFSNEAKKFTEK